MVTLEMLDDESNVVGNVTELALESLRAQLLFARRLRTRDPEATATVRDLEAVLGGVLLLVEAIDTATTTAFSVLEAAARAAERAVN